MNDPSSPALVDLNLVVDFERQAVVLCHIYDSAVPWCRPMINPIFAGQFLFFSEQGMDNEYEFNSLTMELQNKTFSNKWSCEKK